MSTTLKTEYKNNTTLFCAPLLVGLLMCIPSFGAQHQNNKIIRKALSASPATLRAMNIQNLEKMHQALESHLKNTREDFLDKPLFLNISRRNVQWLGNMVGIACVAQGAALEGIKIHVENYNADQDLISGRRETDTCSIYDDSDIPLHFLTGFFGGLISFGIAAKITHRPEEDRLHAVANILQAKKRELIREKAQRRQSGPRYRIRYPTNFPKGRQP